MNKDQKLQELESIQAELWEIQNELNSASEVDDLTNDITAIWEGLDLITEKFYSEDSQSCYTISITDQAPVLGTNGVWTVQRTVTKTKVDCIGTETGQQIQSYSINAVYTATEITNGSSNPTNFSQITNGTNYTFQNIIDFVGFGSLTWKTVRDLKFNGGAGSKTIKIAWGGNSSKSEFSYVIIDSGPPTQQQNGFITTRTIRKIDLSPGKAPNDNFELDGNVYAQDMSVEEIIRLRNTANPNFNNIATPGKYTRADILGLFGQLSTTWKKFLKLEKEHKEGNITFNVLWEFSPGETNKNLKTFLEDRRNSIQNTGINVEAFDDFEGMKLYHMMLIEFQEKFLTLAPNSTLYNTHLSFYNNTVLPEITRVQNLINTTPQDNRVPNLQTLERDPNLQGKQFVITTGLTKSQVIYGRLDYIVDIPGGTVLDIKYVRDSPDLQDDEITAQYSTERAHEIEQGYAQALLNDASRKIQNGDPLFTPTTDNNPLPELDYYPSPGQILMSGNGTTLYTSSNLTVDCYNLQIQDGPLTPITAGPNNMVVGYSAPRAITRVRRNCSRTAIVIMPNVYVTGLPDPSISGATFSGNPAQSAGTPANLARGGDFGSATAYFLANPTLVSFTVPDLVWYLPAVSVAGPPNVGNVPIAPIAPLPLPFVGSAARFINPATAAAMINTALGGLPPNGSVVVNTPQPPVNWVDSIGNNLNIQTTVQQTTNTRLTVGVLIQTNIAAGLPVVMANRFILVRTNVVAVPGLNLTAGNVVNNGVAWASVPSPLVVLNATALQTIIITTVTVINPPTGWVRP